MYYVMYYIICISLRTLNFNNVSQSHGCFNADTVLFQIHSGFVPYLLLEYRHCSTYFKYANKDKLNVHLKSGRITLNVLKCP